MFRIKICGITSPEDAVQAVSYGADAIGLNFYEKSPRFLREEKAKQITDEVGESALQVGVFVNATSQGIQRVAREVGLNAIQLHGDEPPEFLAELTTRVVIRAHRMDHRGIAAIVDDLTACQATGRKPEAILVDAMTPGHFGGTGKTVDWDGLADYRERLGEVPLILAGGLTPENVGIAILAVRPSGVDVASGVECSAGVKDPVKMRSFIEKAKEAFDQISS